MAHILIIDDDAPIRSALRRALERRGHQVDDAQDGDEGIRLYQERPVDLVVTDILMPGKDGIEVVRELRGLDRNVRVIAISGGGDRGKMEFLSYAEAFGADAVFEKPFDLDEFLEAVDELLARGACLDSAKLRTTKDTEGTKDET